MSTCPSVRGALAAILLCAFATAQRGSNCLVVIVDDLGVDQLATYGIGSTVPSTPTIDALAARGVVFEQAWAHPTCSPMRASLQTGRHPFRHGIGAALPPGDPGLALDETTLPEVLDAAGVGYAHALIGKWHLGDATEDAPNAAGWSHFAGNLQGAVPSYYAWQRNVNGRTLPSTTYATTQQVDDALAWIRRQRDPWLCVLSFNAPHTPYEAPPADLHTVDLEGKRPATHPRDFYRAMVQALDSELGRLFAELGPRLARTNIVLVGDNGTPGQIVDAPLVGTEAKGTTFQGGVRVPLIVAGPAVAAAGRSPALLEVVDLFPTVLGLCGVDLATVPLAMPIDGRDFGALLGDPSAPGAREFAYTEQFGSLLGAGVFQEGSAIRDARYKLRVTEDRRSGEVELALYDLATDPWESVDLLSRGLTTDQAARLEDLRAELARRREEGLFVSFGAGCRGVLLEPSLAAAVSGPTLGAPFAVEIRGVSLRATGVVGLLGAERGAWAGFPLPLDLAFVGAPGCELLVAIDDAVTLPVQAPRTAWAIPIPADRGLLGVEFFLQGVVLDANANAAGAVLSDAGRTVIGAR